eukprot:IDg10235t1
MYGKLAQVDGDRSEHDLVLRQLKSLDTDRRCWQQVGATLVEKNVGEVVPALQSTRDNLQTTVDKLTKLVGSREEQLAELTKKYGIREVGASAAAAAVSGYRPARCACRRLPFADCPWWPDVWAAAAATRLALGKFYPSLEIHTVFMAMFAFVIVGAIALPPSARAPLPTRRERRATLVRRCAAIITVCVSTDAARKARRKDAR